MPVDPRASIRDAAAALGFDVCRFASANDAWPAGARLAQFIEAGRHGEMGWMSDTAERRSHPTAMWSNARSAVMLGVKYGPDTDPLLALEDPARAAISAYAQGDDYHELIKGRLKQLAGWMAGKLGGDLKVFVDTAPLMEKPLAQRAGLGWQGKHTNLVSRQFGSWLFLGSILTELDLPVDTAETDHCGQCRACLDICPTKAFPAPYQLDARRCISYLTIEHEGPIPHEFRAAMGNRIYGCDDCLAACPWNKFAQTAREVKLQARDDLKSPRLAFLLALDDSSFRSFFSGSAIKRIGRERFIRNVLIAAGNSGDAALTAPVSAFLGDESPLLRGAAAWAFSRLASDVEFAEKAASRQALEQDKTVQAEWAQARMIR